MSTSRMVALFGIVRLGFGRGGFRRIGWVEEVCRVATRLRSQLQTGGFEKEERWAGDRQVEYNLI